jgi:hypothetical protein
MRPITTTKASAIRSIAIVRKPSGPFRYIVTGHQDGLVCVWRWISEQGKAVRASVISAHAGPVTYISADALRMITADEEGNLHSRGLLDTDTWFSMSGLGRVTSLAFTHRFLVVGREQRVSVYDFGEPHKAMTRRRRRRRPPPRQSLGLFGV